MELNRREAMGNHIASRFVCPFIVTALLLEFFDNFHTRQAEETLAREAKTVGSIIIDHENESAMKLVVKDILNNGTSAMVVDNEGEVAYSFHDDIKTRI